MRDGICGRNGGLGVLGAARCRSRRRANDLVGDGPGDIVDGVDPGLSQRGGDVGFDPRDWGQAFASGVRVRWHGFLQTVS